MKTRCVILFLFISSILFAQEPAAKKINSEVNEVTVFPKGAQITRKKAVEISKGKSMLKFVELSPFIDAKSVQVKADGNITVLGVSHQKNFIDKSKKPQLLIDLELKLKEIDRDIELEETYLGIIKEELSFLHANKNIGGKNQELSIENLKSAAEFYSSSLTTLKLKQIERTGKIEKLNEKKWEIDKQIRTITTKKEFSTGEILVKVSSKKDVKVFFELSYFVENAGWFPSYDIRAKNTSEPLDLIYKANVRQDTKVDWKNVKLKFSSTDPNVSGVAPSLKTYFLDYNTAPPVYTKSFTSVRGKVWDENNESLPGVTVLVKGTTIGTVTDAEGNYSITIPANAGHLSYSFIGCKTKTLPITKETMNVVLENDERTLEDVVVIGYGSQKARGLTGAISGKVAGIATEKKNNIKIRGASSIKIPTVKVENQTSVEFEINTPYTIMSNNKSNSVDMEVYSIPASYQYFSVPKIDKSAFLIANVVDWEKYNLLEGEANIFFEETYVGKTLLDVRFMSDTLEISLGRDKNVSVNREKIDDFTSKQFIGNKKVETRGWKTIVRNNKSQKINMIVLDQVPVSTLDEIEVEVLKMTGANHEKKTGEIKWDFNIDPGNQKELELRYSIKYPKGRSLVVE